MRVVIFGYDKWGRYRQIYISDQNDNEQVTLNILGHKIQLDAATFDTSLNLAIYHLDMVPARIDMERPQANAITFWVHDFYSIQKYPEPYRLNKDCLSEVVFTMGMLDMAPATS